MTRLDETGPQVCPPTTAATLAARGHRRTLRVVRLCVRAMDRSMRRPGHRPPPPPAPPAPPAPQPAPTTTNHRPAPFVKIFYVDPTVSVRQATFLGYRPTLPMVCSTRVTVRPGEARGFESRAPSSPPPTATPTPGHRALYHIDKMVEAISEDDSMDLYFKYKAEGVAMRGV